MPLILLLLLACSAFGQYAVPAVNYYVAPYGSDSNSGTVATAPFLTVGHLAGVIAANQSAAISAANGVHYRQQLTLPAAGITITGWQGVPVLDASDVISSGAWSNYMGCIYQATVTTRSNGTGTGFMTVYENGVEFTTVASLGALTSAGYFVASNGSLTGTSFTLYVYPTGCTNPATDNNLYEYSSSTYGLFSSTAANVSNIWTRRNFGNNGSFEIGPSSFALNIQATQGTKHNALIHKNSTWMNVTAADSYYDGGSKILIVLNDDSPNSATDNALIINPICSESFEAGGSCLYGHVNVSGSYNTVTVKNIACSGLVLTCIGGFASNYMNVIGGTMAAGLTAGSVLGNLIYNVSMSAQISLAYPVPVELNTIASTCSCTLGNIRIDAAATLNVHDSSFSNSTNFDGAIYVSTGLTINPFTSLRNTFMAPGSGQSHYEGPGMANVPAGSMIDYNTYHYLSPGTTSIYWHGTFYNVHTQFASYQAVCQCDAHSTTVTP